MLFLFANLFDWLSDRSFRSPSTPYSAMRSLIRNSENPAPLFKRFFKSINDDIDAASLVISLNRPSRPYAIFRRIVFIVIDSFYRVFFGWSFSHIFQKIFKRISPTLTYFYSATTIVIPTMAVRILGSFNNPGPNRIQRMSPSSFCKTMLHQSFCVNFLIVTPARCRNFSSKIASCRNCLATAITDAIPSGETMRAIFSPGNNLQTTKSFSSEINKIIGTLFSNTAARFRTSCAKAIGTNNFDVSTTATTQPTNFIVCVILGSGNNSKATVNMTGQIDRLYHDILRQNIPYKKWWQAGTVPAFHPVGLATVEV